MPKRLLHALGVQRHSEYLASFMERSNLEVMAQVAPALFLLCAFSGVTTFFPISFWAGRTDAVLACYRWYFVLLMVTSAVFYVASKRLLAVNRLRPGSGSLLLCAFLCISMALSIWVTILDFAEMRRYFFLLVPLIVLFSLFFIHPIWALALSLLTYVFTLTGLNWQGMLSAAQVVTLTCYVLIVLAVSVSNYVARVRVGKTNERIMRASRHDDLTNVLNRRAFDEDAVTYVGQDLFIAFVDIDEFRYFNDMYGHAVGDELLVRLAQTLVATFGDDHVYHFGSDEFIAVCLGKDHEELRRHMDAWRKSFGVQVVGKRVLEVHCSAGVVSGRIGSEADMHDLLRVADMLLYQSKEGGRNQVTYAEYSDGLLRKAITINSMRDQVQADLDELTGLWNMNYFMSRVSEVARLLLDHGSAVSFVYFNVANLKDYNARHGYAEGDELLRFVANTLREVFPNRLLARFSEDRYMLLAEDEGLVAAIERACDMVREARGGEVATLHAGILRYTDPSMEALAACDLARVACESLHGHYDVAFCYYTNELGERMARNSKVLERFGAALECGYIQPYYQPIVRTASDLICEFEILARWVDPHEGILSPAEFIPALEDARLIHLLDLHMVERVCVNYRRLMDEGIALCPVSINFSRLDFAACDVVAEVVGLLDRYELPHELIRVEITESAFAEHADLIRQAIDGFHEQGMKVWMDDFGSEYSSLNCLRQNDFDLVKFDMSFLKDLQSQRSDDPGSIVLTNLANMVKELGLQTLIEGVETVDQLHYLRGLSFEKVQGYVFDRPCPFDEVRQKLVSWTYMVEEPQKRSYYDAVGKVNLMHPVDAGSSFDPLALASGVPVAVLECADGALRYLMHNEAFSNRLERMGIHGVVESENLLNLPKKPPYVGVRAAAYAVVDTDEWVTVKESVRGDGAGFARCVARVPQSNTYAFIYFAGGV